MNTHPDVAPLTVPLGNTPAPGAPTGSEPAAVPALLGINGWNTVQGLVAHLDATNGTSEVETERRLLKLMEEAGEVAQARIGMVGQNPRKGVTHTAADVAAELCDVIVTAAVALHRFTDDPAAALADKLTTVADRAGLDTPAPEPIPARWDRTVIHPDTPSDDLDGHTIVCCLADDGTNRPIGLFLDEEHREALGLSLVDPYDKNDQPDED
jgi:NTP pyrophosphatase (non-canonical NTP hydrolase)